MTQTIDSPLEQGPQSLPPKGVGNLNVLPGNSQGDIVDQMKDVRASYVKAMGWFEDIRDDTDRYDGNDRTTYYAINDFETGALMSSMRLTSVPSVRESLTWSMLENSEQMMSDALAHTATDDDEVTGSIDKLDVAARAGNLYDLTRFVAPIDGSIDPGEVVKGFVEMIGAGLATTTPRSDFEQFEQLKWFFATHKPIVQLLNGLGIESTVISKGYANEGDKAKTYLCSISPINALRYVNADPEKYSFTIEHVTDGLRKANAL
ncbi:MAG: hypothetical protein EOO17_04595 [Chloroflexi bacterium]|nr:MAG: hypothetical protein EOO17_04595 [Chloroflexota bacterium]